MQELIVFPDVEGLVITYLRTELATRAPLVTFVGGRVPTTRPQRFVTVRRTGGVQDNRVRDVATLVVETWAPLEKDAHDLAQICRALLHAATDLSGVHVYNVDEFAGPANLPDPVSTAVRYTATYAVAVRGRVTA